MIRIGLVDLDTSHPKTFTKILNAMPGVKVNARNRRMPPAPRLRGRHAPAARSISGAQTPNPLDNNKD